MKWERKINNKKENKEPHVPGAKGILPIPPKVAMKCIGFFKFGKLFIIKNAHILQSLHHNLY